MCLHGVYKKIRIINDFQMNKNVFIDACIADEILYLNEKGIITLGCCCGHGNSGKIVNWKNAYGDWKCHCEPPHALIDVSSVSQATILGYRPYPYYYANGKYNGVWRMYLDTGCLTEKDCLDWHQKNKLKYEKDLGELAGS